MNPERIIDSYNVLVNSTEALYSIARDTQLQRQALKEIDCFRPELEIEKDEAIDAGSESYANLLLGFQCCLNSLSSEMEMAIFLKASESEKAWDKLIDAQEACASAARAHPSLRYLRHRFSHLLKLEKHVFPLQSFMSAGFICGEATCSVCGLIYGTCNHLAGQPYMGVFCQRVLHKPELDHVSLVDVPNDKRCRVTHFAVEEGYRNKMTWLIEPIEKEAQAQGDHLHTIKSVAYRFS